jgi:molecular chaperone DnaK (HSP70)
VGLFRDDQFVLIVNIEGHRETPKYVAFTDQGYFVGQKAKERAAENPQNTIFDFRSARLDPALVKED